LNTALHYHLAGLGDACGAGAAEVHSAVGAGLKTAAAYDPEPISRTILSVAALVQNFFGHPDCNKIATTQIVNQAEVFLKQNLAAWQSLPADQKNPATQVAALQNFDDIWGQVVQACTGPGSTYGSAGQNCVADRQEGACHYKPEGNCWNWFIGYRDPILNDPDAASNAAATASPLSSVLPAGVDPTVLIIFGGLALFLILGMEM
jgi:hypothetical protein